MKEILRKLIAKEEVTTADIEAALYEVCDNVHAQCDEACPVFEMNDGIPWILNSRKLEICSCFKDGKKMLSLLS